jgi:predicted Rossmann fold nucleotide-binding protein DprA/Smf involved in DNA uptake
MRIEVQKLEPEDQRYPPILLERLSADLPGALYSLGNPSILREPLLGLVCSIQCPGSVIVKTFDTIRTLRDAGMTMIGGFHSPMERECFDILLRGPQPVILCAAKSLYGVRIGQEARMALKEGRLLIMSPFSNEVRRTNSAQAMHRNDLVVALADAVFVPYAAPEGKTLATVRKALERSQKVFALDDEANADLLALGARACQSNNVDEILSLIEKC